MEKNKSIIKKCEICEIEATSICLKCMSYYCDDCFKYVHEKETKAQHKKEKIDYFIPIDTKCPEHPTVPINLFCLDEKGKNILFKLCFIYFRVMLFYMLF